MFFKLRKSNRCLFSVVCVSLMLLMSLSLTACSKGQNTEKTIETSTTPISEIRIMDSGKYINDVNKLYFSSATDTGEDTIYYRDGVWVMLHNNDVTQMQQYLIPKEGTLKDQVKDFVDFDESSATYMGYTSNADIFTFTGDEKFADTNCDFVFIEWGKDGYYYTYAMQKNELVTYIIYNDSSNLFRVYSQEILEYADSIRNQMDNDNTVSTETSTNTESQDIAVSETTEIVSSIEDEDNEP